MKWQTTDAQKAFYDDNGFLVIDDFLDADELTLWQTTTQEAVDERLKASGALTNQNGGEDYYSQVFTQCIKLADTHAGMRELMLDPKLGEAAATLAGVDGVRIWHDQALFKPPFGNPTGWHLDNPFWSFSSRQSISIWVALDDATLANGALFYSPGTHKTATFQATNIGKNQSDLFKIYPEWREIPTVGTPCKAGSAVFHNGLTAHGAGANMTNAPRRAMTCAYMPDGATFNGVKNVLPDAYFQSLSVGDVLDNDDVTPLVWKK